MKFLITGSRGMLASDLIPLLEAKGQVIKHDLPEMDITDLASVRKILSGEKPHVVINCAAYTAVDKAEDEKEIAYAVNATGAGNLADTCREIGARLIHISTDFVFDGKKNRPYVESDETSPLGVYGASKLEGERRVMEATDDYIIIRTSWLYGIHGHNFVKTIARLAAEREDLAIVFDQVGTPTYTVDLAQAIMNLIEAECGIYHFSNEGVCSWYDFAFEVITHLEERKISLKPKTLKPIVSEEYRTPATRPPYSVMNKGKYKKTTGQLIPHWRNGLMRYFQQIEEKKGRS